MRYLAGATICVFLYLFMQIMKTPGSEPPIEIPNKLPDSKLNNWDHDPQLDRKKDAAYVITRANAEYRG